MATGWNRGVELVFGIVVKERMEIERREVLSQIKRVRSRTLE